VYSTEIGVIGFGADVIPDNRSTVYWLKGNIGFGKSRKSRKNYNKNYGQP